MPLTPTRRELLKMHDADEARHAADVREWEHLADAYEVLQRENLRLEAENAELLGRLMEAGAREGAELVRRTKTQRR